jgi:glutamyl-tRNA synthetase
MAVAQPFTIRLKQPRMGKITIKDHVQGEVKVDCRELDDMVLLRSDGTPTYMLAVVVDDYDMGVTHVVRGDDHFNNAFRQLPIYMAMDWPEPEYAHVPLIFSEDGKKLSKRTGAAGVEEYQAMGIPPEAMLNYLARLGWGHGDDELFTMQEAAKWFELKDIGSVTCTDQCQEAQKHFEPLHQGHGQ